MRDIQVILATYGREKCLRDSEAAAEGNDQDNLENNVTERQEVAHSLKTDPLDALDRVVAHFKTSLEGANADLDETREEFKESAPML